MTKKKVKLTYKELTAIKISLEQMTARQNDGKAKAAAQKQLDDMMPIWQEAFNDWYNIGTKGQPKGFKMKGGTR